MKTSSGYVAIDVASTRWGGVAAHDADGWEMDGRAWEIGTDPAPGLARLITEVASVPIAESDEIAAATIRQLNDRGGVKRAKADAQTGAWVMAALIAIFVACGVGLGVLVALLFLT